MADYRDTSKIAQSRAASRSAAATSPRSYRPLYLALLLVLGAIAILVAVAPVRMGRAPSTPSLPRMIKPSASMPAAAEPSYAADPDSSGDNMIVAPDPSRRLLSISYRL